MNEKQKVWVARWDHRHGEEVRVFKTEAGACAWREDIADEWWEHEMPKGRAKPDDRSQAAEEYFDHMMMVDEFFNWDEVEVEE